MIKQADVKDFDKIKKMFINFANSAPVDYLHNPQYDDAHIDQILFNCSRSGVLLYAEQDGKPAGFFIAMPAGDLWLPAGSPVMREAAWWVEPAYREGTVGGKLFLQYLQVCKELKKRGLIQGYTMTLMDQSPKIKLEKYGFKPIETIYYAE